MAEFKAGDEGKSRGHAEGKANTNLMIAYAKAMTDDGDKGPAAE